MGRSHIYTTIQPDENSCGPVSIAHALKILGKRTSLIRITKLCKTTRNGTSTKNMILALNKLGYAVLSVEKATLHHLVSALRYAPNQPRAVIVSYLYWRDIDDNNKPWIGSGHWAAVSGFSASKSRIRLFDSYTGKTKSYAWSDFRERWKDFDLVRIKMRQRKGNNFKIVRKWQKQLILVVANNTSNLPKFRIKSSIVFPHSP